MPSTYSLYNRTLPQERSAGRHLRCSLSPATGQAIILVTPVEICPLSLFVRPLPLQRVCPQPPRHTTVAAFSLSPAY